MKTQGLNSEIQHQGITFHVQTQDKGLSAQYVESIIYKSGKLLTMRKTFYTSHLNSPDLPEKINQINNEHHGKIMREISEGKY